MMGSSKDDKKPKEKKSVHFNEAANQIHLVSTEHPKGAKKPHRADTRSATPLPIDIDEMRIVKAYLENEDEQYKGFIVTQYVNCQDGTYRIKLKDPNAGMFYTQTIMEDRIKEILALKQEEAPPKSPKLC
ncbi:MAG: hypothetical protein JSR17_00465 [Proteobacteria bacterium]|nr:hypothetical protein [Pseudomonadota bacterium]